MKLPKTIRLPRLSAVEKATGELAGAFEQLIDALSDMQRYIYDDLQNHEARISASETTLADHETRITTLEEA